MPYKDPEKNREYQREWAKRNRETQRKYYRKLRSQVLDLFGGKCIYCGCNEPKVLEINHINGGGNKEVGNRRRKTPKEFCLDILKGRRTIEDLELTCVVCNAWHKAKHLNKAVGNWKITYQR